MLSITWTKEKGFARNWKLVVVIVIAFVIGMRVGESTTTTNTIATTMDNL